MSRLVILRRSFVWSTVWSHSPATRCVWLTLLLSATPTGRVRGTVKGLTRRANVTLEECESALATLCASDEDSPTGESPVERTADGWRVRPDHHVVRIVGRTSIPLPIRRAVWARDRGRCVQCPSTERIEYDHIIPVVLGGDDSIDNLQLLCRTCNRQKGPKAYASRRVVNE